MRHEISPQQVASYQEKGFVVIEDFLSPAELATWREVTEEAVRQRLSQQQGWAGLNNQGKDADEFYANVFVQCVRLADTSAAMRELIYDRRVGQAAGTLARVDAIRVWHDQALFKPPYGNPTGWHLDNPYWSFHSRDAISIWVALDDATVENGCMWYVPGSHKTARFDNAGIGRNIGDLFKIYPEWKEIDPVAVPARAGTAVFHNGLCAHGAGANMTNRPRRAMTCAFMPDGSTFNGQRNILPEEYFKTLKAGDVLRNDEQNPVVWAKGWGT